ncbi:MAG: hypothetical protein IPH20_10850 [Bacteroidales bacterium]|nr:hypothetical protein [Bacteroidales bacterium]
MSKWSTSISISTPMGIITTNMKISQFLQVNGIHMSTNIIRWHTNTRTSLICITDMVMNNKKYGVLSNILKVS